MTASKPSTQVKIVEVPADRDGQRLDNFLLARLPGVPKSMVYRIIRKGEVRVNGKRAKPFQKLAGGDAVRVPPVRTRAAGEVRVPDEVVRQLEASVLFEDADLLVCDKPAGIAVHGGSGIAWGLIDAFRQSRPDSSLDLVHRLDRETSGCLLLTKNHTALKHLHQQFSERDTEKRYLTLLDGTLPEARMTVTAPLGRREMSGERMVVVDPEGQSAETAFRVVEPYGDYCLAEALPVTGRTHQIRVHAAHLGAACAGDSKYAARDRQEFWRQAGLRRLFLHAHALSFTGLDGEAQLFSCPLPEELTAVLDRL
jgi:23S rRNA pseudouridine955/2504/2580 synthase